MNNNSNKRWLAIAIAVLLTANVVTLILLWSRSQSGKDNNNRPPQGQVFEYVVKELQLSQQQQDAYAKLRTEHQQGQRMIADSMRNVKDAFFALLKNPAVPDSLVAVNSRKAADMEVQLELLTFRHFQKVRAICTPGQQQKFDKIIEEVLHRMAKPRGGPPPPGREGQGPEGMPPPPPEKN